MPRHCLGRIIAASLLLVVVFPWSAPAEMPARRIDFNRDVRPILSENCFHCHGADASKRKGKLRLDTPDGAAKPGVIVPGKPDESELVARIFSSKEDEQMPPPESNRHLTAPQKQTLRAWIEQGAKYDAHWAFKAPVKSALPPVKQKRWPRNPIDIFVLARLEAEKLPPTAPAPTDQILRRASLDLTGLPPSPEQLKRWRRANDPLSAAVDELLASPHFGERMASDWMDVARYADTHGFNNDSARTMWRWRDWVIEVFNKNLPYDQFITEQLAGDLLEKPTLDQLIATGFNRNHGINSEGGIIDEEYRVEYVADRVRTTALAWMGLTMECARCHDHKFDPIAQRDYYRLFAFFNNVDELGEDGRVANASPMIPSPTAAQQALMAKQRAAMDAAAAAMQRMLAAQDWRAVQWDKHSVASEPAKAFDKTNLIVSLDVAAWNSATNVIASAAGKAKPFAIRGQAATTTGPLDHAALRFDGATSLRTEALPKSGSDKGWAFAAWVKRERATVAPLFSTMKFNVPESSQSYGSGVEIRLTALGAVEVRVARRWPAYSLNVVTRDAVPTNEWRHLLVTSDGSAWARGVRVFIDGEESFRDVRHDDLTAGLGLSGDALIGASEETNTARLTGALADVQLISRPFNTTQLVATARETAVGFALASIGGNSERARRAWLEKENIEFARVAAEGRTARAALLALERDAPTTMVMHELPKPRASFVLFRGQYDQARDPVEPGVPEMLLPLPASAPRNRLGLARWLTDARHPLTARVVVNRFWQSLFGTGIVKTAEDFGFQSEPPSHPELLDWLAREFVASGWDVKKLLRLMVTSATYRQDSRSTTALNERDPENRLLARGPRQRLTAEMLRDQALCLSGLLHEEIGGPPAFPYQPTNLYQGIVVAADYPGTSYVQSKGGELFRRSLYTFWKRTVPHPTLATFDAPDREVCVARRLKTNTPLQALALMNDRVQLEAARQLGERMLREGGKTARERVSFAFQLATARSPDATERAALVALFEKRLAAHRTEPDAELAALAHVASLILNLDETITRN